MYKNRILKTSDATPYSMPTLDARRKEIILRDTEEYQRKAYEEGFASGEKAGLAAGEQKASMLIEQLETIIGETTALKEALFRDTQTQVVDLAIAIARKIIVEEISKRPEIIITMVKEAMRKLQRIGTITIKINPALQELFKKKKSELAEIHSDIVFDVNPGVPVTGPLVISEIEEVVTDIDSLLSNIINEMKAEHEVQDTENRTRNADYGQQAEEE